MTQTSALATNSIFQPHLYKCYLQHSLTLNLILRQELQTTYVDLPKNLDTLKYIIQQLEQSKAVWFNPTPYNIHQINVSELMPLDILTLLHLPHDGKHKDLCERLIYDLEKFITNCIFMILRILSFDEPYCLDTVNFNELKGLDHKKIESLIYFTILNNPRLFSLLRNSENDQRLVFHPNSELIVGRLYQKMYYRRVVRIVYEKMHLIEKFVGSRKPNLLFDKTTMRKSKYQEIKDISEMKNWDSALFMKVYRTEEGTLQAMPVATSVRKSIVRQNRHMKAADDPTLQSLKLLTNEREELLTCSHILANENFSDKKTFKTDKEVFIIQKFMTYRDLFLSLKDILKDLNLSDSLLIALDGLNDDCWNSTIDSIGQSHQCPEKSLFLNLLGHVAVFADSVKNKRELDII